MYVFNLSLVHVHCVAISVRKPQPPLWHHSTEPAFVCVPIENAVDSKVHVVIHYGEQMTDEMVKSLYRWQHKHSH